MTETTDVKEPTIDSRQLAEVRARAAIGTPIKPPPGSAPAPTKTTEAAVAGTVARALGAEETARTIEHLPTEEEAARDIRSRFSGERDAAGALKDTNQSQLERAAITHDKLVRQIVREGFDSLPGQNKDAVISYIDSAMERIPGLAPFLPARGTTERKAYIENWLRDPQNAAEFYQRLLKAEKAAIAPKTPEQRAEVQRITKEIQEAEAERTTVQEEMVKTQTKIQEAEKGLKEFGPKGKGRADIVRLQVLSLGLTQEIAQTYARSELAKERLSSIPGQRVAALARGVDPTVQQAEIDRINQLENRLTEQRTTDLTDYAAKKQLLDSTNAQLEIIQQQEKDFNAQKEALDLTYKGLLTQHREIGKRIDAAQYQLYLQVGDTEVLPEAILQSFETAFVQLYEERFSQVNEHARAELMEQATKEVDRAAKAVEQGLLESCYKVTRARSLLRGSYTSVKPDHKYVREAYGSMLADGPNPLMEQLLASQGFTKAEITARLKDKEFVAKMQPIVAEKIITLKLQAGGISADEAAYIANTKWGGENIIQNAISKNKDTQKLLDELESKGIIEDKTLAAIRRADKNTILKILLAILGAAVPGFVVAGVAGAALTSAGTAAAIVGESRR